MPDHPSFIERLEQVELLERVEHAFACNILNGAKRLNDWNAWNGLISVMNGAHPSTNSGRAEDRAAHGEPVEPLNVWNVWNRRKPK